MVDTPQMRKLKLHLGHVSAADQCVHTGKAASRTSTSQKPETYPTGESRKLVSVLKETPQMREVKERLASRHYDQCVPTGKAASRTSSRTSSRTPSRTASGSETKSHTVHTAHSTHARAERTSTVLPGRQQNGDVNRNQKPGVVPTVKELVHRPGVVPTVKELVDRLGKMRITVHEDNKVRRIIKDLVDCVILFVNENDTIFQWRQFNAGSSYDKSKVRHIEIYNGSHMQWFKISSWIFIYLLSIYFKSVYQALKQCAGSIF